jgi:hypothetical protein
MAPDSVTHQLLTAWIYPSAYLHRCGGVKWFYSGPFTV